MLTYQTPCVGTVILPSLTNTNPLRMELNLNYTSETQLVVCCKHDTVCRLKKPIKLMCGY